MLNALQKAIIATETMPAGNEQAADNQSVVILITGFVVVFLVLLLLIGIIKIYSGIVYAAQKKSTSAKPSAPAEVPAVPVAQVVPEDSSEPDLQTIAVITAAVEAFYSGTKVRIRDIRPVSFARSSWATAGIMENIPAMRTEGLL